MIILGKGKSLGFGSLSLLFFLIGVLFSYLAFNKKQLGEHILDYLKIDIPKSIVTVIFLNLAYLYCPDSYRHNSNFTN